MAEDRILSFVEKVEVGEFVERAQPVYVGMHERDEPTVIPADKHKAGAGHGVFDSETFGETRDKRCLAGPELAAQQYDVVWPKETGQSTADGAGLDF